MICDEKVFIEDMSKFFGISRSPVIDNFLWNLTCDEELSET